LGLNGILLYILISQISKIVLSEISAKSEKSALKYYRIAPIFLFIGGTMPFLWDNWISYVILVPLFLGGFVGAYWTSFHGIRKAIAPKYENNDVGLARFQFYEVLSTIFAASLVVILNHIDLNQYSSLLGSLFALIALILPSDFNPNLTFIGSSTSDTKSDNVILGILTTGTFGILQIVIPWSMRIVALNQGGGTNLLGVMVASATFIGWMISKGSKKKKEKLKNDFSKSNKFNERNWKSGYLFCSFGILIMIGSLLLYQNIIFLIGYLTCILGLNGILRPLEIKYASELLTHPSGKNIGLRERKKFQTQFRFLSGYILIYAVLLLLSFIDKLTINILLVPALTFSLLVCILNLYLNPRLQSFIKVL